MRNRRRLKKGLPPPRRRALNQWIKALTTNSRLKVKVRVREKTVSKGNVKKTRSRLRMKRKTYLILSAIIVTRKNIMQLYILNPIRGRKVRISSLRR
jgi:hypothetical protein